MNHDKFLNMLFGALIAGLFIIFLMAIYVVFGDEISIQLVM
jgi:hypothetical protein